MIGYHRRHRQICENSNSIAVGDGRGQLTLATKQRENVQKPETHNLLNTNREIGESVGIESMLWHRSANAKIEDATQCRVSRRIY